MRASMPARAQSWRAGLRPHRLVQCHAPGSGGLPGGLYVLASVEDRREFFLDSTRKEAVTATAMELSIQLLDPLAVLLGLPSTSRPLPAETGDRIPFPADLAPPRSTCVRHSRRCRSTTMRGPAPARISQWHPRTSPSQQCGVAEGIPVRGSRQAATCTHARAQCHCQGRSPNGYYCAGGRPSTMNERVVATACLTGLILS